MAAWESDADVARYMAETSALLDLTIDPAYQPGVIQFLKLAASMAEIQDQAPLEPFSHDPAPVFRLPEASSQQIGLGSVPTGAGEPNEGGAKPRSAVPGEG
ncbi:MAG: DUF4089 domain-containing protein [Rhodospirillaceae bacterium]